MQLKNKKIFFLRYPYSFLNSQVFPQLTPLNLLVLLKLFVGLFYLRFVSFAIYQNGSAKVVLFFIPPNTTR